MKVLQINCVYPKGSTGKLTQDLHRELMARGAESRVFYGRGATLREKGVRKLCPEWYAKGNKLISILRGIPYGGCLLSTWYLMILIRREKPDVVHLQCINGHFVNQYALIRWLKKRRQKTVLTLHAEFPYTANCAHALDCEKWQTGCGDCPRWRQETGSLFRDRTEESFRKIHRAYGGFARDLTVVSVSGWLAGRAKRSPMLQEMAHRTIYNGVDTTLFCRKAGSLPWKEQVIFHATPLLRDDPEDLKGGWYLLELARRLEDLPVRFVVAGKYRLRGKVPERVTLLGEIQDREALARLYSGAELTLLTSRRETFSMVCAESLCCGTPVVGFQAGGPEEISLPQYSAFVPFGDLAALEQEVRQWLAMPKQKAQISREACCRYRTERMAAEYWQLYREIADEQRS